MTTLTLAQIRAKYDGVLFVSKRTEEMVANGRKALVAPTEQWECPGCGRMHSTKSPHHHRRVTCSDECYRKVRARSGPNEWPCKTCGKPHSRWCKGTRLSNCSDECYRRGQSERSKVQAMRQPKAGGRFRAAGCPPDAKSPRGAPEGHAEGRRA